MKLRFALVVLFVAVVASLPQIARGQTATPVPIGPLTLEQDAPGSYRLGGQSLAAATPYRVSALVGAIGSDQGVVVNLGELSDDRFQLHLPLPLDGMDGEGCYRVTFGVTHLAAGMAEPSGGSVGLDAKACVDPAGVVTFPEHDGVWSPPPAPPSDVRIERMYDDWSIAWRDNSADEIAFEPGLLLFDRPWPSEGATLLGSVNLPEVPANSTSVGGLSFFFAPSEPRSLMCGFALVLVFAVGGDGPSLLPGNASAPACFGAGRLSFPGTGSRDEEASRVGAVAAAVALDLGGAMLVTFGGLIRLRARSPRRPRLSPPRQLT